jgi:hypothetical protein
VSESEELDESDDAESSGESDSESGESELVFPALSSIESMNESGEESELGLELELKTLFCEVEEEALFVRIESAVMVFFSPQDGQLTSIIMFSTTKSVDISNEYCFPQPQTNDLHIFRDSFMPPPAFI